MVVPGGHAWLLWGGMCGCSRGHAWLLWGGHVWLLQGVYMVALGACMVALGGVGGCSGGHVWLLWDGGMCGCSGGACVVALGGHAWLLQGGWHVWDTTRYGDTINEQVVRILLECILVLTIIVKKNAFISCIMQFKH